MTREKRGSGLQPSGPPSLPNRERPQDCKSQGSVQPRSLGGADRMRTALATNRSFRRKSRAASSPPGMQSNATRSQRISSTFFAVTRARATRSCAQRHSEDIRTDAPNQSLSLAFAPQPWHISAKIPPLTDRTVGSICYLTDVVSWGDVTMRTVILIVAWWTLLSCTIGPLLTWVFFWGEREHRDGRRIEARSGDVAAMPTPTGGQPRAA